MDFDQLGSEYLEIFDKLDIERHGDRRIAVRVIHDYYKIVLCEVGQEYLGFTSEIEGTDIKTLWDDSKRKIEAIVEVDAPEEYTTRIDEIHYIRGKTYHNIYKDIDPGQLASARGIAHDFRDWLLDHAPKYQIHRKEMNPVETLVAMTSDRLQFILDTPEPNVPVHEINEEYNYIQRRANQLLEQLEDIEHTKELTGELLDLVEVTHSLEAQIRSLKHDIEEAKVQLEDYYADQAEIMRERQSLSRE